MTEAASDKAALRREMRARRRRFVAGLSERERAELHLALARVVVAHIPSDVAIAAYVAHGSEVDPRPIVGMALDAGMRVGFPYFRDRDAPLEVRDGLPSAPGPFGFPQPAPSAKPLDPDLLLVPLVAADELGNRIGQGAGHFDRYLAELRKRKPFTTIGLAYDVQILPRLNADPWDVPLDAVATPTRWIAPARA